MRICHFRNIIFTLHQGCRELTAKDEGMGENMSPSSQKSADNWLARNRKAELFLSASTHNMNKTQRGGFGMAVIRDPKDVTH